MSASSRTYTYYQYAPVASGSGGNMMNGSVTTTLTDLNGNGATLSTDPAGHAIYTATMNDVAVQTLWNSQFGFTVGQFLSGATVPASFANVPMPSSVAPDGTAGVVLRFTLSAGDAVSFAYTFNNVVPGPGALAMLACAGYAANGRRRKG